MPIAVRAASFTSSSKAPSPFDLSSCVALSRILVLTMQAMKVGAGTLTIGSDIAIAQMCDLAGSSVGVMLQIVRGGLYTQHGPRSGTKQTVWAYSKLLGL